LDGYSNTTVITVSVRSRYLWRRIIKEDNKTVRMMVPFQLKTARYDQIPPSFPGSDILTCLASLDIGKPLPLKVVSRPIFRVSPYFRIQVLNQETGRCRDRGNPATPAEKSGLILRSRQRAYLTSCNAMGLRLIITIVILIGTHYFDTFDTENMVATDDIESNAREEPMWQYASKLLFFGTPVKMKGRTRAGCRKELQRLEFSFKCCGDGDLKVVPT